MLLRLVYRSAKWAKKAGVHWMERIYHRHKAATTAISATTTKTLDFQGRNHIKPITSECSFVSKALSVICCVDTTGTSISILIAIYNWFIWMSYLATTVERTIIGMDLKTTMINRLPNPIRVKKLRQHPAQSVNKIKLKQKVISAHSMLKLPNRSRIRIKPALKTTHGIYWIIEHEQCISIVNHFRHWWPFCWFWKKKKKYGYF